MTLCHFHHHLVHEGGYGVERTDEGRFRFTHPGGYALDDCGVVERWFRGNISKRNRDNGIQIDPSTIGTRWLGERMDYSLAIDAMIAARQRQREREAPGPDESRAGARCFAGVGPSDRGATSDK